MTHWSRAKIGKSRVFWCVVKDIFYDAVIVAEGYEESIDDAERAAQAVAGGDASHWNADYARRRHSEKAREQRAKIGAKRTETQVKEYLYSPSSSEYFGFTIYAHLIRKKTRRRVYVTRQSLPLDWLGTDREDWSNPNHDPNIVVDRQILERDGRISPSRRWWSYLYLRREDVEKWVQEWVQEVRSYPALGIEGEITVELVKAAYRRKVKEVHPDRGGSTEAFRAVEEEYRMAMKTIRSNE